MPNEVRYPGPLTQPYACTLAGAQTSSHRAPFPRRVGEEKRRTVRGLLFPKPGATPHFSWNGTAVRRRSGERGVSMQGRVSGPGYLTSLGTKPPPRFIRTLRYSCSNRATMSSRQAAATNLATPN